MPESKDSCHIGQSIINLSSLTNTGKNASCMPPHKSIYARNHGRIPIRHAKNIQGVCARAFCGDLMHPVVHGTETVCLYGTVRQAA